jgi:hypothetical protein
MRIIITEEQYKRVLKEDIDTRSERVKSIVKKYGLKQSIDMIAGGVVTIRQAYNDNPLEFLNQFNNLTPVERDDYYDTRIYYMDENNNPIFYYVKNGGLKKVFFNFYLLWVFFIYMGYPNEDTINILKKWLNDTYGIRGFEPTVKSGSIKSLNLED